ncbi:MULTISPECIES: hypothetical protein [unclassified Moorena]|uniref:hypothetical protein n=1 Tax=unclassified Moorena TaxID=2683338 RepID=UPI0013FFD78B|nr:MULTISPECIES: hypothetical protein [unclassified Moorena]NEO16490.1 hypothetical protein [Moorena sp. SIO3E8]NEQ03018.1 hypothetical protein [Moorena sp. SIO3F7]
MRYTIFFTSCLLPLAFCLLPLTCSLLPAPDSLLPTPYSLLPFQFLNPITKSAIAFF